MRVWWDVEGRVLRCRVRLDPWEVLDGTGQGGRPLSLVTDRFRVELPVDIDEPHPDLLAVAAWTVLGPWVARRFVVDRPVSAALAQVFSDRWNIELPVDPALDARSTGPVPGLSYSGGVDSIAVAEVIPRDAPYVHFRRVRHPRVPDRATPIRADLMERLVLGASDRGRDVHVVRSDLEYLCLPWPTFPNWAAVGIGLLLLADRLQLGAAGFGTVLGSKFLTSGARYRAGGRGGPEADLYRAVGLPLLRPATGMSEVITTRLAQASDLADLGRSCLLGDDGPCLACTKCFRKELTSAAIEDRAPTSTLWERVGPDHAVLRSYADGPPWHMQHVLEYALTHAQGIADSPAAWMLDRVPVPAEQTTWVTRYYPRALEVEVPEPFRADVRREVEQRVTMMDLDDVHTVETWDAAARSGTARTAP